MSNSCFSTRIFFPRICSHHWLVLRGLPIPCCEHPGPPQSRAAGRLGYNGIMEYPELGGTTRIMECNSWPWHRHPNNPPPCAWEDFHLVNLISVAIFGFSPHTSHPPARSSLRAPFPSGFHSSKWPRDGLNNAEIFSFMQETPRNYLSLPLPQIPCAHWVPGYLLRQQLQHSSKEDNGIQLAQESRWGGGCCVCLLFGGVTMTLEALCTSIFHLCCCATDPAGETEKCFPNKHKNNNNNRVITSLISVLKSWPERMKFQQNK